MVAILHLLNVVFERKKSPKTFMTIQRICVTQNEYNRWQKKNGKCLFDVILAFTKKSSWFFVEKPRSLKMRTHFYVAAIHMVHASYYMKAKIDFALHLQRIILTLMLSSVSISLPLSVSLVVLSSLFKYNMLHSPHWFEPT